MPIQIKGWETIRQSLKPVDCEKFVRDYLEAKQRSVEKAIPLMDIANAVATLRINESAAHVATTFGKSLQWVQGMLWMLKPDLDARIRDLMIEYYAERGTLPHHDLRYVLTLRPEVRFEAACRILTVGRIGTRYVKKRRK